MLGPLATCTTTVSGWSYSKIGVFHFFRSGNNNLEGWCWFVSFRESFHMAPFVIIMYMYIDPKGSLEWALHGPGLVSYHHFWQWLIFKIHLLVEITSRTRNDWIQWGWEEYQYEDDKLFFITWLVKKIKWVTKGSGYQYQHDQILQPLETSLPSTHLSTHLTPHAAISTMSSK